MPMKSDSPLTSCLPAMVLWPTAALLSCLYIAACGPNASYRAPYSHYTPPSVVEQRDSFHIYAVIQVPAGTARVHAFDSAMFMTHIADAPTDFLPAPGNLGFIAGCVRKDTLTGRGTPLPVMVMMPALETGSILAIKPIAALILMHNAQPFPVIVGVPEDPALRSIQAHNFVELLTQYDGARNILQTWFLNYPGRQMFDLVGWRDDNYARHVIAEWRTNQ